MDSDFDSDDLDVDSNADWDPRNPGEKKRKSLLSRFVSFVLTLLALIVAFFVIQYLANWSVEYMTAPPPVHTQSTK